MWTTIKLRLEHEAAHDLWTLRCEDVRLEDVDDIQRWRAALLRELDRLDRKIELLVDMNGFSVSGNVSRQFGRVVRSVTRKYTRGVYRYGRPADAMTRANVRLESITQGFDANLFASREDAVRALVSARAQSGGRRSGKRIPAPPS